MSGGVVWVGSHVSNLRTLFVCLVSLMLAACASGGPSGKEVLTSSIAPSKARIVMYRMSPLGLAIQPSYTIDGKAVAPSQPSGFIVCDVNPGKHTVAVANIAGDQSIFNAGSERAEVDVAPGQTAYLLAQPQVGLVVGYITISQVNEAQGRKDTAALSKIEGQCA